MGADFVKFMDFWAREGSNFHQKIWLESFEIRDSSRLIRRGDDSVLHILQLDPVPMTERLLAK